MTPPALSSPFARNISTQCVVLLFSAPPHLRRSNGNDAIMATFLAYRRITRTHLCRRTSDHVLPKQSGENNSHTCESRRTSRVSRDAIELSRLWRTTLHSTPWNLCAHLPARGQRDISATGIIASCGSSSSRNTSRINSDAPFSRAFSAGRLAPPHIMSPGRRSYTTARQNSRTPLAATRAAFPSTHLTNHQAPPCAYPQQICTRIALLSKHILA